MTQLPLQPIILLKFKQHLQKHMAAMFLLGKRMQQLALIKVRFMFGEHLIKKNITSNILENKAALRAMLSTILPKSMAYKKEQPLPPQITATVKVKITFQQQLSEANASLFSCFCRHCVIK